MITKKQLRAMHGEGLPLHILELDYVESIALKWAFARSAELVFKGGTCLRKAYGLNRFSEDLDFAVAESLTPTNDVMGAVERIAAGLKRTGIPAELKDWQERPRMFLCRISYEGPIFAGGAGAHRGTMDIEVSKFKPMAKTEWRTIITEYPDAGTYSIQCASSSEMLAEKFRALIQRKKPRDVYDIWFLTKKGVKTDVSFVNAKLAEAGASKAGSLLEIVEKYHPTEQEWLRDMGPLMLRPPAYTDTITEVMDAVKSW